MRKEMIIVLEGDSQKIEFGTTHIPMENLAREIMKAGKNHGLDLHSEIVALKIKRTEKLIEFGAREVEAVIISRHGYPDLFVEQTTIGAHVFLDSYRRRSKEEVRLINHEKGRSSRYELVAISSWLAGLADGALRSKIAEYDSYCQIVWDYVVPEALHSPDLFTADTPSVLPPADPTPELPPVDPTPELPPADPPVDWPPVDPTPRKPPVDPQPASAPVSTGPAHRLLFITRTEAVKGAVKTFDMNGKKITVEIPAGTNEETRILLKREGLDKYGNVCDVEVQFHIK